MLSLLALSLREEQRRGQVYVHEGDKGQVYPAVLEQPVFRKFRVIGVDLDRYPTDFSSVVV